MAKNILQDIVPPEKRSIRNIPVPVRRNKPTGNEPVRAQAPAAPSKPEPSYQSYEEPVENNVLEPKIYPYEDSRKLVGRGYSKKTIWIASLGAIVFAFLVLSALFSGATINVTPKTMTVSADGAVFTAYSGSEGNGVPFEVVKLTKDLGKDVPASGEEEVEEKASGQIIIYNNFDSNPQRLIKNTRFETPEGLIYRINDSVVVPGRTTEGSQTVPGSVEVTVYADEAGEKYNIGLKDFTIPGFKDDEARFKAMYARSKTEMTGGFMGTRKKVSEADLANTQNTLHADLSSELQKEIGSQIPTDFVFFPDSTFITYESLPQTNARGDSVQVNERGTMTVIMFNKNLLSSYLNSSLNAGTGMPSSVASIENLPFAIQNKETVEPNRDTAFNFGIEGDITFVNQFDTDALKKDLAGEPKKQFTNIVTNYPAISEATHVVRPFWKRSFPKDAEDITVNLEIDS